eukprot:5017317-Prymnesium_polylepis.1
MATFWVGALGCGEGGGAQHGEYTCAGQRPRWARSRRAEPRLRAEGWQSTLGGVGGETAGSTWSTWSTWNGPKLGYKSFTPPGAEGRASQTFL